MGSVWKMLRIERLLLLSAALFLWVCSSSVTASVTYDGKSILINGQRRILISGSIHYPRSTPEYYFEGRFDLVRFIKVVQQAGLYVHLRIGPFVCAEWNFGGFPVWLKYVPGIQFRTDNEPFKIENEYGPVEWEIGAPGKAYTKWAADMAVRLGTGVPWIMCKQEDAPDPIIDTCNGFYCEGFTPNKNYKPKMWTEAWTGWYTEFGGPIPYRPAEDLAFSVARFIQNNGSFINYYMYHGGTNFGRTAAGLFIATSYDYDAPIDEYGLLREPKWGHLRDLHKAIKLSEPALVSAYPTVTWPGKNLEVHVFQSKSACAAFLANYDTNSAAKITFQKAQYDLPPWSVSILPDCKNAVFNTARVSSQSSQMKMTPASSGAFSWQSYSDEAVSADDSDTYAANGLLEQIKVTRDASDYLWYLIDVNIQPNEGFLKNGQGPVLTVMSAGHALHVFINGQLSGSSYGALENPKLTFSNNVKLRAGINKISLLSVAVGLPNVGVHYETWNTGVLGPVTLKGLNEGTRDLTNQKWSYKVGLKGEGLSLNTLSGSSSVEWVEGSLLAQKQPLTWYKTTFNAPGGNDPLALDMSSMGKGQVWINGESIGRHWPGYIARGNCGSCSYAGTYNEKKCLSNCGESSQRWYHVPRSWLKPSGNFLVVLEEWGGDPTGISLVRRTSGSVCADIYEGQPTTKNWHLLASGKVDKVQPKAQLSCAQGQKISQIKFASYGLPQGTCGSFREGSCHAHKSYDALEKVSKATDVVALESKFNCTVILYEVWPIESEAQAQINSVESSLEAAIVLTIHSVLEENPHLIDVMVPVGFTLTAAVVAWLVIPLLQKSYYNESIKGTQFTPSAPFPYEASYWGALEDPLRCLIGFFVLSLAWKRGVFAHAFAVTVINEADRTNLASLDTLFSNAIFGLGLLALAAAVGFSMLYITWNSLAGELVVLLVDKDNFKNVKYRYYCGL
ncbi:hypothetical protein RHMOL_Rhmol05G0024000 [Rhododendron molle]|uniref:Uncharacterized protein n=1 Tax=Rhododendron molle TaxID=49168 RepID=A0ACC0NL58_RHOML|nr:hypothetical protein RHMOL_Rhmol05G0024000 [Rhododendron molle]